MSTRARAASASRPSSVSPVSTSSISLCRMVPLVALPATAAADGSRPPQPIRRSGKRVGVPARRTRPPHSDLGWRHSIFRWSRAMSPASSANLTLVCRFSGGADGEGNGVPSASGSILSERCQIEVDDLRIGPVLKTAQEWRGRTRRSRARVAATYQSRTRSRASSSDVPILDSPHNRPARSRRRGSRTGRPCGRA